MRIEIDNSDDEVIVSRDPKVMEIVIGVAMAGLFKDIIMIEDGEGETIYNLPYTIDVVLRKDDLV